MKLYAIFKTFKGGKDLMVVTSDIQDAINYTLRCKANHMEHGSEANFIAYESDECGIFIFAKPYIKNGEFIKKGAH